LCPHEPDNQGNGLEFCGISYIYIRYRNASHESFECDIAFTPARDVLYPELFIQRCKCDLN